MDCGCWNREIQEEHRAIESEREALKSCLEHPPAWKDRRIHLSQILRSLDPALRLHLHKEEETLFPAFERLVGSPSGTLPLLKAQHDDLRTLLDRLPPLLEDRENTGWRTIRETGETLVNLLEEHEEKESRFIADILEYSLRPQELTQLAREFQHAESCGCEEES